MEGLAKGNTPFEKAMIGRHKGQLMLVTHLAVKELVKQIDECDNMIAQWETESSSGKLDEATLSLATQALKDKNLFEAALVTITQNAAADLGLEA